MAWEEITCELRIPRGDQFLALKSLNTKKINFATILADKRDKCAQNGGKQANAAKTAKLGLSVSLLIKPSEKQSQTGWWLCVSAHRSHNAEITSDDKKSLPGVKMYERERGGIAASVVKHFYSSDSANNSTLH